MSDERYDDAEEPEDPKKKKQQQEKFEGFHFTRLGAVVILTFIILVVALILDSLSTFHKLAREAPPNDNDTCRSDGVCGWREATTTWVDDGFARCPSTSPIIFNYATRCDEGDDDACVALDSGNVYLAFTIFAVIFNLFTMCIILPLYCRERSIFMLEICDTHTKYFLACLFFCGIVCNLIAICVWLGGGVNLTGVCDDASAEYRNVFTNPATGELDQANNYPSYSSGGLMIVLVANIVACGAVTCCWGDNREYGDEMDHAKRQRQKERDARREQEMA